MIDVVLEARMKTILLVSTTSDTVLSAAKRAGLRVLLLDDSPVTCGAKFVDEQFWRNPYDLEGIPEVVTTLAPHLPVDGVLTTDERAVPFAAQLGVPCPRFEIAETEQAAVTVAVEKVGFPLVMKPLFGTASQGVVRVNG